MKHTSVKMNMPCEFLNIVPVNPLISKCQIKVCYVDDKPNRNGSIITKEVAKNIANSLPGSPIIGCYNEHSEDFEEHNISFEIVDNEFKIKNNTKPYGFVDLGAKVWFQKFLDDGIYEREYLVTEGYIWTGRYPETQRIFEQGNNHSMELDQNTMKGTWTKDGNENLQFFIVNEAIISGLCILGEDFEPCFEGSQIAKINFSFDENFKNSMFSMLNELKEFLEEGGVREMFTRYNVEIGDSLWNGLYKHLESTYPDSQNEFFSIYRLEGIFENGEQKFAVLQSRADDKYYRLNFTMEEENFIPEETLIEVTKSYTPEENPQFALEEVEKYEQEFFKKKEEEEEKEKCSKCGKPFDECECEKEEEEKKKKSKYNFDTLKEIAEYIELKTAHEELTNKYSALGADYETLKNEVEGLRNFKKEAERKEKQAMIDQFYMLSDEDKADVISNIDNYSLDDIEAKLSIICVRNRVSFNIEEKEKKEATVFNLNSTEIEDASVPAWVKSLRDTAKTM